MDRASRTHARAASGGHPNTSRALPHISQPSPTRPRLLERDAELDALTRLVDDAALGRGRVGVVQGPPGIGKTALAAAARERAEARGMTVRAAVASELDREFPFGVVVQLLAGDLAAASPERRERLLAGAAALAAPVLEPDVAAPAGADASFGALQGLYWLVANLAEEGPLLLLVDDLHWADPPSLRLLEFVGRRLEGLPVLILGTARPVEPGTLGGLLDALASGPAATVVRPAPITAAATARMVAEGLGAEPEPEFVRACHAATGGNPLLVAEVVRSASERGLRGRADESDRVADPGASDVAARVRRRLVGLGTDAERLARAVAVLGQRASLAELASLAGLPEDRAVAGADALAAAAVLDPDERAFVHPLVREAVRVAIPPAERAALHGRAARILDARGARPAEVALHLLASEPAGDPRAVAVLREAAAQASAEGAGDVAAAALRRALQEPPSPEERAAVLVELGEIEVATGGTEGVARLDEALAAGAQGDLGARAHAARGRVLLLQDPAGAAEGLAAAVEEAEDPALEARLRSGLLATAAYDAALEDRLAAMLAQARGRDPAFPEEHAHLAIDAAYRARPNAVVRAHAEKALRDDALLARTGLLTGTFHLLVLALRLTEDAPLALAALDAGDRERARTGSRLGALFMDHGRAYWAWSFGSLTAAEGHARAALAAAEEMRFELARTSLQTILAEILLARGETAEARELAAGLRITPAVERTIAGTDALTARAWVAREDGRGEEAERDLRRARELLAERGWAAPHKARATVRLAELLAERDDGRAEAVALADETIAVADRAGLAGARGIALRVRARALPGAEAVPVLQEAVACLAGTDLRLDAAWAVHDLGAARRRAGDRRAAREDLRAALDAAVRLGAGLLADSAREELAASGARLRTEVLEGVGALTPSELRVAELAARGMSNREIAESLWVSRKTVEVHLGRAYAKLGIRSRSALASALAGGAAEAPPAVAG